MGNAPSAPTSAAADLTERQARLIIESAVDYAIVRLDLVGTITSGGDKDAAKHYRWSIRDSFSHDGFAAE